MPDPKPQLAAESQARLEAQKTRLRMQRLAQWLDAGIGVPGTRLRVGVESLIGLIPVAGDLIGLLLGSYFLYEAARVRAPAATVLRMLGNVVFDALIGLVPFIGDLADFAFKSNQRNARLLDLHLDTLLGAAAPARRPWWRRAGGWLLPAALAGVAYALWSWWS